LVSRTPPISRNNAVMGMAKSRVPARCAGR
jgi:hypothetical protein